MIDALKGREVLQIRLRRMKLRKNFSTQSRIGAQNYFFYRR